MKKQAKDKWKKGKAYKVGDIFYTLTFYDGKMHIDKLQITQIQNYTDEFGRLFILHNLRAKADMDAGRSREGWLWYSSEDYIGSRFYETPLECFKDIQLLTNQKLAAIQSLMEEFYQELVKVLNTSSN